MSTASWSCGRPEIVNNYLFDTIPAICESESRIIRRARKHHKMAETFIPTTDYNRIVKALAALKPCRFHGRITTDQVKIVMGEVGNFWPDSIKATR